ncbi:MAG: lipopolysaccharide transport system ATP-binding protein [Bacteroidia bacterium]|jgi:lipopolysaccharide transport system ATP-binding protein
MAMSETVISVQNVSKQYRLGTVGVGSLREDLVGLWYKVRGKDDPHLKLGEANDRSTTGSSDYVWALKDINFEVKKGEVLGIIGKNGAGKSTLLKLLSRVTAPTTGEIKAKGRIASLLEVGTGFHPELTGRENIFLNGAIMGMKHAEINEKLDEIVEFAGVQRYIDTPVKRYSSGMYVRLAFAVAAHLEPEILIVDEVLAVGDADFQKKAIGKMQDVSTGEGRTVLFVSHNMKAVNSLCDRCLIIEDGTISFSGDVSTAVDRYLGADSKHSDELVYKGVKEDDVEGLKMVSAAVESSLPIKTTDCVNVSLMLDVKTAHELVHVNLQLKTSTDVHLLQSSSDAIVVEPNTRYKFNFQIPSHLLNESQYKVSFNYVLNKSTTVHTAYDILWFTVCEDYTTNDLSWYGKTPGLLSQKLNTSIETLS